MHVLNFNVAQQVVAYCASRPVVAASNGHVFANFTFDEEWAGLAITAVFKNDLVEESWPQLLTGGPVEVPSELLVEGYLTVSLEGYAEGGELILSTAAMRKPIKINRAGPLIQFSAPSTPELWKQVLAALGNVSELDTANKSNLVAAVNETFARAGSGGAGGIYFGPGEMPEGYREQVVLTDDSPIYIPLLTREEIEEIKQAILDELRTAIVGVVGEDNVITITAALPPGSYAVQYEFEDGSTAAIGTITVEI